MVSLRIEEFDNLDRVNKTKKIVYTGGAETVTAETVTSFSLIDFSLIDFSLILSPLSRFLIDFNSHYL